jgi:transposase
MLTLEVLAKDIPLLKYEKYSNSLLTVQKRAEIILLLATQPHLQRREVASIVDVDRDTVTNSIKLYTTLGIEGLLLTHFKGQNSVLNAHKDVLEAYFEKNPPLSTTQAIVSIKELTQLERSPSQVRNWMRKAGMNYQKTAQIPAKADPVKQQQWLKTVFEPLAQRAKKKEIEILFLDSMHCVMGVFLCFLWSFKRIFVKSSAGRQRLNVIGVVNAITKKISFITNTETVNAQTMIRFLQYLRDEYDRLPIYIILDNARYQHCKLVEEFAKNLDIHLTFLPPYSPNLNLIERLWKWTKKKCLYAKYYDNFDQFCKSIQQTLQNANQKHQKELENLLTLKFQKF